MPEQWPLTVTCPLCGNEHSYTLTVTRSEVHGMAPGDLGLPSTERTLVQLLTCATSAQPFEAELTLMETALTRVESLAVSGPSDG